MELFVVKVLTVVLLLSFIAIVQSAINAAIASNVIFCTPSGLIKVPMGCGSWKCNCGEPHSIPFEVHGKSGSVKIKLMPAPKGVGLAVEDELKKIFRAAGYKDIWSKSSGQTRKKTNFVNACGQALLRAAAVKR